MNYRPGNIRNATLAALALSLTLSACAPANQESPPSAAPSVTASETATVAPTATATPTPTPTAVTPTAAPETHVAVSTPTPDPVAPKLATFTFPDGHISFEHPANWTIKTEQGPYLDHVGETDKAKSVEAHIYDETGNKIAVVASGGYGGGAAGPSLLTVLDSEPIQSFPALNKGGTASFAFIQYENPFDHSIEYRMGTINSDYVTNGEGTSGSPYLLVGNGAALGVVEFSNPAFKSLDSAKAWMKSAQYSKLKAMLTSMKYVES